MRTEPNLNTILSSTGKGRSFAALHRLAHRFLRCDRVCRAAPSSLQKVLCQFGRPCKTTSPASLVNTPASVQSFLRVHSTTVAHSSSAEPAVVAPTEV